MPKVIIREVTITETTFDLRLEFDFALIDGGSAETFNLSISKPEYLFWKETNPAGTVLDYIKYQVKPHYEKLLAQKTLATTLNLLNKELSW